MDEELTTSQSVNSLRAPAVSSSELADVENTQSSMLLVERRLT